MNPILIVEDNDKNLKLVRDVLQFKGYRTVEARTADEGLRLAKETLPVLILMDIQLPDMDGITAGQECEYFSNSASVTQSGYADADAYSVFGSASASAGTATAGCDCAVSSA